MRQRGKPYSYYQEGRGTVHAGPRHTLPVDPQSSEFWAVLRKLQGLPDCDDTIGALIDSYIDAWPGLRKQLAPSTQDL